MKKIIPLVVVVLVVFVGIIFAPKVTHTCDSCDEFFVGAGYEPGVLEDLISDEDQIICEECAKKQHAVALALGKSLEEFERDIF